MKLVIFMMSRERRRLGTLFPGDVSYYSSLVHHHNLEGVFVDISYLRLEQGTISIHSKSFIVHF